MYSIRGLSEYFITEEYNDTRHFDAVKRSPLGGYQIRKKFVTFVPRKFKRRLRKLTDSDITILDYFFGEAINYGQDTFEYYDTKKEKYFLVCLGEDCLPLKFKLEPLCNNLWWLDLTFVQVTNQEYDMSIIEATQYQRHIIPIEDLAAGSDISDRLILGFEEATTLLSVYFQVRGTPSGIDDSNTVVITLKNGAGSTVITKTYNAATQPPTDDFESLGTLSIEEFEADDKLTLSITCGATANLPACALQIRTEKTIE